MADEFIPELTLNPNSPLAGQGQAAAAPAPAAASTPPAEAHLPESDLDEAKLSPAQRKAVEDFARTIDITDSNVVLQYGAAAQKSERPWPTWSGSCRNLTRRRRKKALPAFSAGKRISWPP